MGFRIIEEALNGLLLLEPDIYFDERGYFMETWKQQDFEKFGIPDQFVQENHSSSLTSVYRGLHFQWDKPMGKLIRCISGKAMFVELDIRYDSPTLGKYYSVELSRKNRYLLWVPPGYANGFLSLRDNTEIVYKCTAHWNPNAEAGILWNDPALAIDWGKQELIMSEKDRNGLLLSEWLQRPESKIFTFWEE